ncbi:MAG: hypothetical protein U0821_09345 [Chloroflexota bacterium]
MTVAVRVFQEADVKCYHCGHTSGTIRRDQEAGAPSRFKPAGSDTEITMGPRALVQCARCGGPTFFDSFETRQEWGRVDFLEDRPRRGRPPKALLARRGAA